MSDNMNDDMPLMEDLPEYIGFDWNGIWSEDGSWRDAMEKLKFIQDHFIESLMIRPEDIGDEPTTSDQIRFQRRFLHNTKPTPPDDDLNT
jgi:hypothetical protein